MKLILENIGKIKKAEVEIGGLTIIAGENDTGKSTIGKVLFSLIKGTNTDTPFMCVTEEAYKNNCESLYNNLSSSLDIALFDEFNGNLLKFNSEKGKIILENLLDLEVVKYENQFRTNILNNNLRENIEIKAFKMGDNTPINPEEIQIGSIVFLKNKIFEDITLITTPYILDFSNILSNTIKTSDFNPNSENPKNRNANFVIHHIYDLLQKIKNSVIYNNKGLNNNENNKELLNNIKEITGGYWTYDNTINQSFYFIKNIKDGEKGLLSWDVASGVKSFALIEMLIKGGLFLSSKKPLIIDEPEIHLHPEWQIKYAKIIVELVKNNIPVILTSHSGDFIQSLMLLINKDQKLIDKTSICFAKNTEEGAIIENGGYDVKKNKELISKIYDCLTNSMWRAINNDKQM